MAEDSRPSAGMSEDTRPSSGMEISEKRVRECLEWARYGDEFGREKAEDTAAALEYLLEVVALIEENCGDFPLDRWLACESSEDGTGKCDSCSGCRLNALLSRWRPAPRCSCGYSGEPVVKNGEGTGEWIEHWYACPQCGKPWEEKP